MSIGPGAANGACHFDWQFSAGLRSTTAALAAAALAHVQAKPAILLSREEVRCSRAHRNHVPAGLGGRDIRWFDHSACPVPSNCLLLKILMQVRVFARWHVFI